MFFGRNVFLSKGVTEEVSSSDRIHLQLSEKTVNILKKWAASKPVKKKWVEGTMKVEDKSSDLKLKFHGNARDHYIDDKYSFTIKFSSDKKTIFSGDRYKLVKGGQLNPSIMATNQKAHEMGLIANNDFKMVELFVNGENWGAYCLYQDIRKDYLTHFFGHKKFTILANYDDFSKKNRNYMVGHFSDFDQSHMHIKGKNDSLFYIALSRYKKINKFIENRDIDSLKPFVDIEYMGKFLALSMLYNDPHFLSGDNVKLIYNHENDKFYPLFRIETIGAKRQATAINLKGKERPLSFPLLDEWLWVSDEMYREENGQLFFKECLRINKIRLARNKELHKVVSSESEYLYWLDSIHMNNKVVMEKYEKKKYHYDWLHDYQKNLLKAHLVQVKKYLNYSNVYTTEYLKSDKCEILIDAFVPLKIYYGDSLLKVCNSLSYTPSFQRKYKVFNIIKNRRNVKDFVFVNEITGDTVKTVRYNKIME